MVLLLQIESCLALLKYQLFYLTVFAHLNESMMHSMPKNILKSKCLKNLAVFRESPLEETKWSLEDESHKTDILVKHVVLVRGDMQGTKPNSDGRR